MRANTDKKQAMRRTNLRSALVLSAVAVGLFIYTLVHGFK